MVCTSPFRTYNGEDVFPCGRCIACRIQRSNEWAVRLMHESLYWDSSLFLTLTYNNENLPEYGSLKKEELVKFLKRVNNKLNYMGRKFKYFASGEYGEEHARPHYHIVAFGLDYKDFDKITQTKKLHYSIKQWKCGFIDVLPLNYYRARYTAKYILKQVFGEYKNQWPPELEQPMRLSSQELGLNWAIEHKTQIEENGYILVNGKKRTVPRYYIKKLELVLNEDEKIKRETEQEIIFEADLIKRNYKKEDRDIMYHDIKKQQLKNTLSRLKMDQLKRMS